MQPSGSPSTHPSQDSLSSGDAFLFSDDDSGVFLSEEGGATAGTCLGRGGDSPASHWARDGFGEVDDPASTEVGGGGGALASAHTPSTLSLPSSSSWSSSGLGQSTAESGGGEGTGGTRGDTLFAQKCLELQGFVRPLLELLNGLKRGRFDKGLSTFQQSVAMDRIQRIVGVLQKPHIGEKYLPTLLQVEMMLKNWFPQVTLCPTSSAVSVDQSRQGTSSGTTPPHKHRDQLHIPVKKRRLSWSDSDFSSTPPPVACRCSQVKGHEKWSQQKEVEGAGRPGGGPAPSKQADRLDDMGGETSGHKAVHWSEPHLTWVHVAPIFSPPKSCPSHEGRGGAKQGGSGYVVLTVPPPTSRGSPATQDSSVSSTTPFSDPVGCQNQPLASANPANGRGQSPPIMTQP